MRHNHVRGTAGGAPDAARTISAMRRRVWPACVPLRCHEVCRTTLNLTQKAALMTTRHAGILWPIAQFIVIGLLSGIVLVAFLRPSERHWGINKYSRARFMDMVDGRANKPFVYRTLLPSTVRAASLLVPDPVRQAIAERVERTSLTRRAFARFEWDTWAAFQYLLAAFLMFLCFMGFSYGAARLTIRLCGLPEGGVVQLALASAALIGLPPLFRHVSYPYDPATLFLFTLALCLMVWRRQRAFLLAFLLCCLNKETAVLLIPLFALTGRDQDTTPRQYWGTLLGLVVVYGVTRLALVYVFRDNPGTLVEFYPTRNLGLLTTGWTFTGLTVALGFVGLIFFRWGEKPAFLKTAFAVVLLPLLALALFLGYVEELRGYYEAYPIVFGLIVHSVLRLKDALAGATAPARSAS
jgi:hypothetical protein